MNKSFQDNMKALSIACMNLHYSTDSLVGAANGKGNAGVNPFDLIAKFNHAKENVEEALKRVNYVQLADLTTKA